MPELPESEIELLKWRLNVDNFIADSGLHRKATAIRLDAMERNLEANTVMTTEMHSSLREAIPVILDLSGAARTVKRIGEIMKPLLYVGGLLGALWVFGKTGKWAWP